MPPIWKRRVTYTKHGLPSFNCIMKLWNAPALRVHYQFAPSNCLHWNRSSLQRTDYFSVPGECLLIYSDSLFTSVSEVASYSRHSVLLRSPYEGANISVDFHGMCDCGSLASKMSGVHMLNDMDDCLIMFQSGSVFNHHCLSTTQKPLLNGSGVGLYFCMGPPFTGALPACNLLSLEKYF